ncbi:MAG: hypothetical protein JXR20_00825 [Balneola sp.]
MIKKHCSYLFYLYAFCFSLLLCTSSTAQYINIQIELEPELEATVLSELNFGDIIVNSGTKNINLGDPSMGIFSVTAINSQILRMELQSTNILKHLNPAVKATIPIDLQAAYNNSGTNNPDVATPFGGDNMYLQVNENAQKDRFEWQTVFIYIYGFIDVGNVPNGIYEGELSLVIDYE